MSPVAVPLAFITGATSGIGYATAHALARQGFRLVVCGRDAQRLESLRAELAVVTPVHALRFDLGDETEVRAAVASLPLVWQEVDVLVNSAGGAYDYGPVQDGNAADWDAMLASNVHGLLYVTHALLPQLPGRGRGHIVNVSSAAGKQAYANASVYCATKAAVESLSQSLRLDLLPLGVKVTNIAPGAVETGFSQVRFKGDAQRAAAVYEGFEPLQADDVADAIVYAVTRPAHVQIADLVIYPRAQAAVTTILRAMTSQ
ncbi:SDR family NAD(P)-dependent oxidoreductase [Hymenobacter sp.]|uniref:SDR family NAD(P)-dependent oxidoreductase n=1 Tax=Hymenobacter sp. TaxID=1898978 RepID=UPI00286C1C01|nr:SDR family NAD(P)-dependent oxidoreductase [Hymenobacter sp.]